MPENQKSQQKLAELIRKAPRLLGTGGLFGGLNEEHGLMEDFMKFAKALKRDNEMNSETVNIAGFLEYLGDKANVEDIGTALYEMKHDGEIVEDPHNDNNNTLFNLAETLTELGVGADPNNILGEYEKVLRETLQMGQGSPHTTETAEARQAGVPGAAAEGAAGASTPEGRKEEGKAELEGGKADIGSEAKVESEKEEEGGGGEVSASVVEENEHEVKAKIKEGKAKRKLEEGVAEEGITPEGEPEGEPETPNERPPVERVPGERAEKQPEGGKAKVAVPEGEKQAEGAKEVEVPSEELIEGTGLAPLPYEMSPLQGEPERGAVKPHKKSRLPGTARIKGVSGMHIRDIPGGGRMKKKKQKRKREGPEAPTEQTAQPSTPERGTGMPRAQTTSQNYAGSQAARPAKKGKGKWLGLGGAAGIYTLYQAMDVSEAAGFGILQKIIDLLT